MSNKNFEIVDLIAIENKEYNSDFLTENLKSLSNEKVNKWLVSQFDNYLIEKIKDLDLNDKIKVLNELKLNEDLTFLNKKVKGRHDKNNKDWSLNEFIDSKIQLHFDAEVPSSSTIYVVVPFLSSYGVNRLKEYLLVNSDLKINIISTTYNGESKYLDLKGLIKLKEDYPLNINIKIENSFANNNRRIHSKIYIFERKNGFSSAYIGSSNFTKTGFITGKETSLKISQFQDFDLFKNIKESFNELWNSNELVDILDKEKINLIIQKQFLIENSKLKNLDLIDQLDSKIFKNEDKTLFVYQRKIVEELFDRIEKNINKHLLVMATGTGKTFTIAKFVEEFSPEDKFEVPKVIYLAPGKEILEQTIITFKEAISTLDDSMIFRFFNSENNIQDYKNEEFIFSNVETLRNNKELLKDLEFDIAIFDEAHHTEAKTFQEIFKILEKKSKQIIGMTATPERTDGINVSNFFGFPYVEEIRIFDAIDKGYLSDFDYYFINDDSKMDGVDINIEKEISKVLNTEERNEFIYETILEKIIPVIENPKTVLFASSVEHAKSISHLLNSKGLKAEFLVSYYEDENNNKKVINKEKRNEIIKKFKNGEIEYLVVRDILNEGIDIPEINSILFLRPTSSPLIFLQQLGRGLRKLTDKKLQVFDFVNNVDMKKNKTYDPVIPFKAFLQNHSDKNILDIFNSDSNISFNLPGESTFYFDKMSKKKIINLLEKRIILYKKDNLLLEFRNKEHTYKNFEEFFNFIDDELFSFYKKNTYFEYESSKNNIGTNFKTILKNFSIINNLNIINMYKEMLIKKQKSNNEIINNLFFINFYSNLKNNDEVAQNIELGWKNIFKNETLLKEILFVLEYLSEHTNLRNNKVTDDKTSFIGINVTMRQAKMLFLNQINNNVFKGDGQQSGIWSNLVENSYAIAAKANSNLGKFGYKNKIIEDANYFLWDPPSDWQYDVDDTNYSKKDSKFINKDFNNLFVFFNDSLMSKIYDETIYKILTITKPFDVVNILDNPQKPKFKIKLNQTSTPV